MCKQTRDVEDDDLRGKVRKDWHRIDRQRQLTSLSPTVKSFIQTGMAALPSLVCECAVGGASFLFSTLGDASQLKARYRRTVILGKSPLCVWPCSRAASPAVVVVE